MARSDAAGAGQNQVPARPGTAYCAGHRNSARWLVPTARGGNDGVGTNPQLRAWVSGGGREAAFRATGVPGARQTLPQCPPGRGAVGDRPRLPAGRGGRSGGTSRAVRSEEHTSELQSRGHLVCRLLLEKKKKKYV